MCDHRTKAARMSERESAPRVQGSDTKQMICGDEKAQLCDEKANVWALETLRRVRKTRAQCGKKASASAILRAWDALRDTEKTNCGAANFILRSARARFVHGSGMRKIPFALLGICLFRVILGA